MNIEAQYLELLAELLSAPSKDDRTGTGTRSLFGRQIRHDMSEGFPLLTTKKVHFNGIMHELLWFLAGDTNIKYLHDNNVKIWNEWANEDGELGPIYGKQWRDFNGVDQIEWVVNEIKTNPTSRRLIVSAWNPEVLPVNGVQPKDQPALGKQALPPCHTLFQFYVQDGKLSLQLYQRSADVFLGVPYNIASYALLLEIIAKLCDLKTGEFVHTFGDVHVYNNHINQAKEQLSRTPLALPTLEILGEELSLANLHGTIRVHKYKPHPAIKAPISI